VAPKSVVRKKVRQPKADESPVRRVKITDPPAVEAEVKSTGRTDKNMFRVVIYLPVAVMPDFKATVEHLNRDNLAPAHYSIFARQAVVEFIENAKNKTSANEGLFTGAKRGPKPRGEGSEKTGEKYFQVTAYLPEAVMRDFKSTVEHLNRDSLAPAKYSVFARQAVMEFIKRHKPKDARTANESAQEVAQ
jgi:hypothetical protein